MGAIKIDDNDNNDRGKMRYLLRQLSLERLDRAGAIELRPLLLMESSQTAAIDSIYRKTLLRLIDILDKYVSGEVNLMPVLNLV